MENKDIVNNTIQNTKAVSKHIFIKVLAIVFSITIIGTTITAVIYPPFRYKIDVLNIFSGPEKTIQKMEDALNEKSFEKVFECLSPKFQNKFKLALGITNVISGFAGAGMTEDFMKSFMSDKFYETLGDDFEVKLNIVDISYNNDKTKADVTIKITSNNSKENDTECIKMIKSSNDWYLDCDFDL